MPLKGADSATPKPDREAGHQVWGVYVAGATFHVWTKEEVAALASNGIEGVIPIVVPPQNENWWELNFGYAALEALVREARDWGLPEGSPICLDVEEHQSSQMKAPGEVLHAWQVACATHKMRNWVYGSKTFLEADKWGLRWLAEWPTETPTNPELPQGFQAWQYKGDDNGIDLDIFEDHRSYLSPHLEVVSLPKVPKGSNAYWGSVGEWATWMAQQLTLGSSYTLDVTTAAVDQYIAGETVTDPTQAQNLWSMIFSTGTHDPRYVPPIEPVPEVKGSNPSEVAQLAQDLASGDTADATKIETDLGLISPASDSVASPSTASGAGESSPDTEATGPSAPTAVTQPTTDTPPQAGSVSALDHVNAAVDHLTQAVALLGVSKS